MWRSGAAAATGGGRFLARKAGLSGSGPCEERAGYGLATSVRSWRAGGLRSLPPARSPAKDGRCEGRGAPWGAVGRLGTSDHPPVGGRSARGRVSPPWGAAVVDWAAASRAVGAPLRRAVPLRGLGRLPPEGLSGEGRLSWGPYVPQGPKRFFSAWLRCCCGGEWFIPVLYIINNIALGSRVEALWWYKCSFPHVWFGMPVLPNVIFGRLWLFSLFHIALHRCWNHWTFFFHIGNVALDNLQIKENALVSIPVISSCISGSEDWALGLLTVCSLTSQSVPSLLVSESGAWLMASNTANVIGTKGKKVHRLNYNYVPKKSASEKSPLVFSSMFLMFSAYRSAWGSEGPTQGSGQAGLMGWGQWDEVKQDQVQGPTFQLHQLHV